MPLTWSQLKKGLDPKVFTVRTAPSLIAKSAAWQDYNRSTKKLSAAAKKLAQA
jgi:bifunctional non-homologous end joining protein LigD